MAETRTYASRARYLIQAVARRRKELREKAILYKGGQCSTCGYQRCHEALEFHHPGKKDFGISHGGYTRSWEKVRKELDRCVLLCANCHREVHTLKT